MNHFLGDYMMGSSIGSYNLKKGLAAGIVFFLVTGLVTELIPNPLYTRMVSITVLDYVFLFTTSILAAIYFGKNSCRVTDSRLAGVGGITGFLAFGCPTCNAILLTFFSTSAIIKYIDPLRPFFGLISTATIGLLLSKNRIQDRLAKT